MPYETLSQDSPEAQSPDLAKSNLDTLSQLFPSVVRDGQVDVDALRQLVGEAVDEKKELYGLNWHGKREARAAALTPSLGTLRPCKEDSVDWDTTKNLYIEGDNLEVLKLLQKSYAGKVKMIYIDPPYNTGKDFIYSDNYRCSIDEYKKLTDLKGKYEANLDTSGKFHTKWLNMMYSRLMLARTLLKNDGMIFISIDDCEQKNLCCICNEIFGEDNFIACAVVKKSTNGIGDKKGFAENHEYVICYQKSHYTSYLGLTPTKEYIKSFNSEDKYGRYKTDGILMKKGADSERSDSPTMFFPIYYSPQSGEVSITPKESFIEKYPIKENGTEGRWTWSKETITSDSWKLYASPGGTIYIKDYFENNRRMKIKSILDNKDYITDKATNEIKEFFGEKIFDTPKPIKLIYDLIDMSSDRDDIILDFFSGSSSTAHAVLKKNYEDHRNRRFIMIQLDENLDASIRYAKGSAKTSIEKALHFLDGINKPHILTEIGKERIRRAGKKLIEEAGLNSLDLDIGFRVFKLDSSNVKPWNPQTEDLVDAMNSYGEHLVTGRTNDDFLAEIMLKSGIELTEKTEERIIAGHTVHSLGYGQYYACMDDDLANDAEAVALGIAEWREEQIKDIGGAVTDTGTVFVLDKAFNEQDAAKMNFVAILEQHGVGNIKAL